MRSSKRSCNYELIAHHFQLLFQNEARPRTHSSPKLRHTQKRSSGWRPAWIQSGTDNSQISLCSLRSVYKAPHRGLGLPAADQSKQSLSADPLLVHRSADHPWVFMILWAFYAPDGRRGPEFSVFVSLREKHIWKILLQKLDVSFFFFFLIHNKNMAHRKVTSWAWMCLYWIVREFGKSLDV